MFFTIERYCKDADQYHCSFDIFTILDFVARSIRDGAICTQIKYGIVDSTVLCCCNADVLTNSNMQNFPKHTMFVCVKCSNNHFQITHVAGLFRNTVLQKWRFLDKLNCRTSTYRVSPLPYYNNIIINWYWV